MFYPLMSNILKVSETSGGSFYALVLEVSNNNSDFGIMSFAVIGFQHHTL